MLNSIFEARKSGALWLKLEVRESNLSAQSLYYKYGFRKQGKRRHYYQDNKEDALVLWTERLTDSEFIDLLLANSRNLGISSQDACEVLVSGVGAAALATAG